MLKVEPEFASDDVKPLEESNDIDDNAINSADGVESDMDEENENSNELNSVDKENHSKRPVDNSKDDKAYNNTKHSNVPEFFKKSKLKANVKVYKNRTRKEVQDNKVSLNDTNTESTNKQSDLVEADSTTNVTEDVPESDSEDVSVQIDTSDEDPPLEDETILVKTPPGKESQEKTSKYEPLVTKYASSSGTFTVTSTEHSPTVKRINKGM